MKRTGGAVVKAAIKKFIFDRLYKREVSKAFWDGWREGRDLEHDLHNLGPRGGMNS